jgi:hypothetical protein
MSLLAVLVGALAGAGAGWFLARRRRPPGLAPGVSAHLLPDPALDWLRRAHRGLGVWMAEMHERDGPRAERVGDGERLSVAQIVAVDRRLERARDQDQSGAERMEGGTLVFHAAGGIAVALLLSDAAGPAGLAQAEPTPAAGRRARRRPHHRAAQARTEVHQGRERRREPTCSSVSSTVGRGRAGECGGSGGRRRPRVWVVGVSGRTTGDCSTACCRPSGWREWRRVARHGPARRPLAASSPTDASGPAILVLPIRPASAVGAALLPHGRS